MASRQFLGSIKKVSIGGDGPDLEVQIVFAFSPHDMGDLAFLAGVKAHGQAVIDVKSAQGDLWESVAQEVAERVNAGELDTPGTTVRATVGAQGE